MLDSRRFIVTVGSGGVGKTTLAAAVALESARRGFRTLVMTFDPSLRLKDTLGVGEAARLADVEVATGTPGSLHASLLDARTTFDRLIERYAPDEAAARRILGNRFYAQLSGTLSGVLEYMAVERLFEVAAGDRYDRVVLDTPPTRQALDFLEAPARLTGFLDSGALRIALKPWFDERGRLGKVRRLGPIGRGIEAFLDRVVGLGLLRDMAEFFQAFAPLYEGFRTRAGEVGALLQSSATGFLLVTRPEEDRVAETLFFARRLSEAGHHVDALAVNMRHPEVTARAGRKTGAAGEGLMEWLGRRDRRGLDRFRSLVTGTRVLDLPLMAEEPADLRSLDALRQRLVDAWA